MSDPAVPELPTPSLAATKANWRTWARARRATLNDGPARWQAIYTELLAFLESQQLGGGVLAYHALPGEPDVSALASAWTLYTTRAVWTPHPHLTLHDWRSASERSRFGAMQPPSGTPQISRDEISAVLLPGLAFDAAGTRLGYGGGFYDRLLEGWEVLTIGVTPAALVVERLPREPHDLRVEYLATEGGVARCQP
ncbi:5-formyltetrahydrofolate cyclo-ligase [Deinococcus sp.]|uniref:5-formyltetrahydrofolate cyclo-ligase n=1 Tax=Deinococcus sp. TaxID=47478 RepID=UPI003CC6802B